MGMRRPGARDKEGMVGGVHVMAGVTRHVISGGEPVLAPHVAAAAFRRISNGSYLDIVIDADVSKINVGIGLATRVIVTVAESDNPNHDRTVKRS